MADGGIALLTEPTGPGSERLEAVARFTLRSGNADVLVPYSIPM
ncbi:hypothetical protein [Nocardiopsis listeri]|nr:hypothetical protein [Nocardiopsis listeri]